MTERLSNGLAPSPGGRWRATICASLLAFTIMTPAAHATSAIAFHNESDPDKDYDVTGSDPVVIASVTLEVSQPSNVLVQFTSHAATEDTVGCPCSVRAMLKADEGKPQPVRRINLAAPGVVDVLKYEHDRQGLDGSYVFEAEPGKHTYTLIAQQQTGSSKKIEIYYPNLQAIAFPK